MTTELKALSQKAVAMCILFLALASKFPRAVLPGVSTTTKRKHCEGNSLEHRVWLLFVADANPSFPAAFSTMVLLPLPHDPVNMSRGKEREEPVMISP
mmetsp:Transcript_89721/g.187411  ORF Transcript_89721/g.187411 Transcript_89721/m.187411 type:complete len:98 (+) Transcript_89721:1036-1329(+)